MLSSSFTENRRGATIWPHLRPLWISLVRIIGPSARCALSMVLKFADGRYTLTNFRFVLRTTKPCKGKHKRIHHSLEQQTADTILKKMQQMIEIIRISRHAVFCNSLGEFTSFSKGRNFPFHSISNNVLLDCFSSLECTAILNEIFWNKY